MTKLLSDEEIIAEVWSGIVKHDSLAANSIGYPSEETSRRLIDLFNTQKRLYAAKEREEAEVSGQLAAVNHLDGKIFYIETNPSGSFIKRVINNYRDELSHQYAELRRIK